MITKNSKKNDISIIEFNKKVYKELHINFTISNTSVDYSEIKELAGILVKRQINIIHTFVFGDLSKYEVVCNNLKILIKI